MAWCRHGVNDTMVSLSLSAELVRVKKKNETPVRANQLRGSRLVYDLVYNPIETRFMREGREAGCDVLSGLEMLVAQACHQFKLMTKTDISSKLMYAAGLSALTGNFPSSS